MKKKIMIIKCIAEGQARPRWYLPVRRNPDWITTECWLFPLAPFALVYFILARAIYLIWTDLVQELKMLSNIFNQPKQ